MSKKSKMTKKEIESVLYEFFELSKEALITDEELVDYLFIQLKDQYDYTEQGENDNVKG